MSINLCRASSCYLGENRNLVLRLVKNPYCLLWTVASCGDNLCGSGDTFTTAIMIWSYLLMLPIRRCRFRELSVSWLLCSAASWLITLLEGWSARWPSWWSPLVGTASPLPHPIQRSNAVVRGRTTAGSFLMRWTSGRDKCQQVSRSAWKWLKRFIGICKQMQQRQVLLS